MAAQVIANQEAMSSAISTLDTATATWLGTVNTNLDTILEAVNGSEYSGDELKRITKDLKENLSTLSQNYDNAQKRGDAKIDTIKNLLSEMDAQFQSEGDKGVKAVTASAEEANTQMPE